MRDNAETTDEFIEYNVAITTLTEAVERLLTITSLGYALKMLKEISDGS